MPGYQGGSYSDHICTVINKTGVEPVRAQALFNDQRMRRGFPSGAMVKNLPTNSGDSRDVGLMPGSGISPGGRSSSHSSILAWKIPWTEEPGGLVR